MLYAIDIDKTIAIDRVGSARWLNNCLSLGIPERTITSIAAYWQFLELAPVQAFREQHEQAFQVALTCADQEPEVLLAMEPLPGALAGVKRLAEHHRILYTTCRRQTSMEVTRAWLASAGFPSPESAISCSWYHDKYVHAHQAASQQEPVILIDDLMEEVVKSFGIVAREHYQVAVSLLRRVEVVGFGYARWPDALPRKLPFATSLLASWDALETWLEQKERDGVTPE
ncbi:MAG TPA: hypothetical protein VFV38_21855 [Ktedonobacteraceae bacterium]|nr:hypothetical protein [Ktedonobacteraceae bacterium]